MLIIKFFLLFVYIVFSSYFTGVFTSKILKKENDIIENSVYGFIINIALTQFLLWPFVAFRWSSITFCTLAVMINIIPSIIGIYYSFKQKKNNIKIDFSKTKIAVLIVALILLLIEIVLTQKYYRSDADDSFYVSNSKLFMESKNLNEYDSSFGNEEFGTVPMYDFQIWESLVFVYSFFLNVEPAIVAHTFLIPIMLVLATMAMYILGKTFFKDTQKAILFVIFLSLFSLFGGYSTYAFGSRILSRIWQGKTIYHAIVLPAVIAYSMRKPDYVYMLDMLICVLAAVGLNPTSLFIIGFEVGFLAIASSIYKKNFKYILFSVPALATLLTFALLIYFRTSLYPLQMASASHIDYSGIVEIIKKFFGGYSWIYVLMYVCGAYFGYKKGSDEERIALYIFSFMMLIFVWNPISGKIIAENITKVSTFWRVYWLIPFSYAIVANFIHLLDMLEGKRKIKAIVTILFVFLIAFPGKWLVSKENNFVNATNLYKVPEDTLKIVKYLENKNEYKPLMLASDDISTTIRQVYTNVELIFSREQYVLDLVYYRGMQEDAGHRNELQKIIRGEVDDYSNLEYLLNDCYNIKYVVIEKDKDYIMDYFYDLGYEVREIELDKHILLERI